MTVIVRGLCVGKKEVLWQRTKLSPPPTNKATVKKGSSSPKSCLPLFVFVAPHSYRTQFICPKSMRRQSILITLASLICLCNVYTCLGLSNFCTFIFRNFLFLNFLFDDMFSSIEQLNNRNTWPTYFRCLYACKTSNIKLTVHQRSNVTI